MKSLIFLMVAILSFSYSIRAAETKENGDANANDIASRKLSQQIKYSVESTENSSDEDDEYPNDFSKETPKEISAYLNDMEARSLKKGFNAWAGRSIDDQDSDLEHHRLRQLNLKRNFDSWASKRFIHLPYKNIQFLKLRDRRRPWGGAFKA